MNILVIGSESDVLESQQKFGLQHHWFQPHTVKDAFYFDVIFNFTNDDSHLPQQVYSMEKGGFLFLNTSAHSLHERLSKMKQPLLCSVAGFAGLPTFVNRQLLEVSASTVLSEQPLREIATGLGTGLQIVADRAGMLTPAVVCMIINEAYYTLMDGTASRDDIDLAMKMGTNYPYGPFEWCTRIGHRNVCSVLNAMRAASGDDRYLICPLLIQESLQQA